MNAATATPIHIYVPNPPVAPWVVGTAWAAGAAGVVGTAWAVETAWAVDTTWAAGVATKTNYETVFCCNIQGKVPQQKSIFPDTYQCFFLLYEG